MAKTKTTATGKSVDDFINETVNSEQKRKDSYALINLMQEITGNEPYMWGPSIIGFGNYHYRYESGHEGDAPLLGFSPRKSAISLYVFTGLDEHAHLLDGLGKFTRGKACIYVKKLDDLHLPQLKKLMKFSVAYLQKKYGKPATL